MHAQDMRILEIRLNTLAVSQGLPLSRVSWQGARLANPHVVFVVSERQGKQENLCTSPMQMQWLEHYPLPLWVACRGILGCVSRGMMEGVNSMTGRVQTSRTMKQM